MFAFLTQPFQKPGSEPDYTQLNQPEWEWCVFVGGREPIAGGDERDGKEQKASAKSFEVKAKWGRTWMVDCTGVAT